MSIPLLVYISIYQRFFKYIDDYFNISAIQYIGDSTRNIDLSTNYDIAERAYTPQYLDDMHEVAEWK